MKRIIIALFALALAFPAYATKGGGNNGNGVGNTGPGNQGNNKPVGNAGGPKGEHGPKGSKGPKGPKHDATDSEQPEQSSGGGSGSNAWPMIWVGGLLLMFVCEKENNREDKTPVVAFICTPGEMPDAFESYAQ